MTPLGDALYDMLLWILWVVAVAAILVSVSLMLTFVARWWRREL